jgi:hypothetical protein
MKSHTLAEIKVILEKFIEENKGSSINLKIGKNKKDISVNRNIFEVECFLNELIEKNKINEKLNATIYSKGILNRFNSTSYDSSFKQTDYQWPFLFFILNNYSKSKSLYHFIDEFVEKHKEYFSVSDIVTTKTGATRCKTSIRFALNNLRNLGLIFDKDNEGKRSWMPSIFGLITVINYNSQNNNLFEPNIRSPEQLTHINSPSMYDEKLLAFIKSEKESELFYLLIKKLEHITLSQEETNSINQIVNDYYKFIDEAFSIEKNGITRTSKFKDAKKVFDQRMVTFNEKNSRVIESLIKNIL